MMIQLNLTLKQAFYLKQILWNVGGNPKGPRGSIDEIWHEMSKYNSYFKELDLPELTVKGSVMIDNYEKKA